MKQTEIDKIPKKWEVVNLDDVAYINKASIDPTKELPDKKFFYIDIDSVENGTGVLKNIKEIIGKDAPSRARRVIHYNDVIMSTVRPYLKAFALVPQKYDKQICSTGFAVLSCKEKLFPLYLLYSIFSRSVINQCNRMMIGGQYPALNTSQVVQIKIPLPPLPEQKKIAEVLSTVDEAIQKIDEAIEYTQRLKKGLMQVLLTKGIGYKEFRNTKIGRIPKGWAVVKLGDISTEICRYPTYYNIEYEEKGIPEIRGELIKSNGTLETDLSFYRFISQDTAVQFPRTSMQEGDFVVSVRGTMGKVAIVPKELKGANITANLMRISPDRNRIYPLWLHQIFMSDKFQDQLKKVSSSTTIKTIKAPALKSLKLSLPPLSEQKKIAEILSSVDEKLELLRVRKEKFTRLKNGLMNELLTGKKRVKI